ncbi:MAG: hypothetical protein IJI45_04425 [Anaerolineaceae bacterium]|jgi:hypothetical protein|nr:hypothetical protein [Anaerolineaceae bacterium]
MDEMKIKTQILFLPQMTRWKRNALCLQADEFSDICVKIYGVFVNVHYQMDGIWIDIGDQTIEDESLCKELSGYLGLKVESVHIDDDENVHVWIIYEGEKNGQNL